AGLGLALLYAFVAHGAFFADELRFVHLLVVASCVVAFAVRPPEWADLRAPTSVAVALVSAALVGTAALADDVRGSLTGLRVVVVLGLAALVVRRLGEDVRRAVLSWLVAGGTIVALAGWAGVAFRRVPFAQPAQGLWRAASTITYANALACLLAVLVLVLLSGALRWPRWHTAAASFVLLTGLGATLSRSGLLALVAGLAVVAWTVGPRRLGLDLAAPIAGAALALAGLLPSIAGTRASPAVAAAALAAGALCAVAPVPRLALIAVLVAVPVVMVAAPQQVRRLAYARLAPGSDTRSPEWRVALRAARERPLTGVGPTAPLPGPRSTGPNGTVATWIHSEPLGVLARQGIAGGAANMSAFVVLVVAGMRTRRRMPPGMWAAGAAGGMAVAVHSLFDITWHVPVLPLLGAVVLSVALYPPQSQIEDGRRQS
ncbi:MAG TPA: O-antigen ligase family protein, partial [Actinomycetota bacterium]|nr:O-antigen ligase family protein [Actinomycetota bacterium]